MCLSSTDTCPEGCYRQQCTGLTTQVHLLCMHLACMHVCMCIFCMLAYVQIHVSLYIYVCMCSIHLSCMYACMYVFDATVLYMYRTYTYERPHTYKICITFLQDSTCLPCTVGSCPMGHYRARCNGSGEVAAILLLALRVAQQLNHVTARVYSDHVAAHVHLMMQLRYT